MPSLVLIHLEKLLRKNRLIFDNGPLFLYFAGCMRVKEILDEVAAEKTEGYTCETNIAELYYKTCEKFGREVAEIRHLSIRHSKISILAVDDRPTRVAGSLKALTVANFP